VQQHDPATEKLVQIYRKLSPVEQDIARMLAFFLVPVARTNLAECLTRAGVRLEKGRAIYGHTLLPYLQTLQKSGLVTEVQGGFSLRKDLHHPLIRELECSHRGQMQS
jgi:hypothetical protein